jgi:hypothetical protein
VKNKNLIIIIALLVVAMFMISACDENISGEAMSKGNLGVSDKERAEVNVSEEKIFCNDSDGNDTYNAGFVTTNLGVFNDECDTYQDSNGVMQVKEYICNGNVADALKIECEFGCEAGACLEEVNTFCNDSDGGFDYYSQGTCVDSNNNSLTDFCNGNALTEYLCGDEGLCTESHNSPFVCPNGCEAGACIVENNPNLITIQYASLNTNDFSLSYEHELDYGIGYNYLEVFNIFQGELRNAGSEDHEEYGDQRYLEVYPGPNYKYIFETPVPLADVSIDPIELDFLGRTIYISGGAYNQLTLRSGNELWLDYDESVTVIVGDETFVINVTSVYYSTAIISVNGIQGALTEGDVEDFGFENFELYLMDIINDDGTENDAVKIMYGEIVSEVAQNNHAAELLGYGDDTTEAEWVWSINTVNITNGVALEEFGVKYNQNRDQVLEEITTDWELPALEEGDSIYLADGSIFLTFSELNVDDSMSILVNPN